MNRAPVIAIDGISGAGKGTIAGLLSQKLQWHYLDSGKLYRIIAFESLYGKTEDYIATFCNTVDISFRTGRVFCNNIDCTDKLNSDTIGMKASALAKEAIVREAVDKKSVMFRKTPGLVADGRDMASKVFPDAILKFHFTANSKIRAERRLQQLQQKNITVDFDDIHRNICRRDKNDATRALSPLQTTSESIIIDTSSETIDATFDRVWQKVLQLKASVLS